jgi:hypothetical protein
MFSSVIGHVRNTRPAAAILIAELFRLNASQTLIYLKPRTRRARRYKGCLVPTGRCFPVLIRNSGPGCISCLPCEAPILPACQLCESELQTCRAFASLRRSLETGNGPKRSCLVFVRFAYDRRFVSRGRLKVVQAFELGLARTRCSVLRSPQRGLAFGRRPPNTRRRPSSGWHPKPFAEAERRAY